jgi:hypothetical protein
VTRKALCIGIDDYPAPPDADVPADALRLRGSVNDALAWADVLAREFNFGSVRVLLDSEATRANVVHDLDWLVSDTNAGDVRAIVFSGHATYVVDTSGGDEVYDEAICTVDGLLSDDDFANYLDLLHDGARLTVVSDSCFAAGVLDIEPDDLVPDKEPPERWDVKGYRPKGYRPKGYRPKGYRPKFMPPSLRSLPVAERDRSYDRKRVEESRMRETLLAACGPGKVAFDDDFDGTPHGVMTYYAIEAMRAARYRLTYDELLGAVRELIPQTAFAQRPELEGNDENKARLLFT